MREITEKNEKDKDWEEIKEKAEDLAKEIVKDGLDKAKEEWGKIKKKE